MSGKLEIQERSTQSMLCPCCGKRVSLATRKCGCGARFVGEPLDETPIKVQRLGPVMISVGLLAVVIAAALLATKWMAVAALLVIWSSWRAMQLARRNADWYGGYKTAVATLTLTIVGSLGLATYGVAHIPKAIENYKIRQIAATQASMHHIASLLEEYKMKGGGSYPSAAEFKKVIGDFPTTDYWDSSIKYEPGTDSIADTGLGTTFYSRTNFELRSAGPDGISGNDDDIIMRNGILFTNGEAKKQTVVRQLR